MISLVALVAGLSTVVQAAQVFPRQAQASPSECCFLYVKAAGVIKYETEVKNVTVATVIKEVIIIGTATDARTTTRTRTVYDATITNVPAVTLPYASLTGTAVATDLTTLPVITNSPPSPDPNSNGQIQDQVGADQVLIFTAPQYAGVDGQPSCEGPLVSYTTIYSAQQTFTRTITGFGNPFLSATTELSRIFQYNAAIDQGKTILLANPAYFPATPLAPAGASATASMDLVSVPEEFIQYMAKVPKVLAQYPNIAQCTAKVAQISGTSINAPVNPVTVTSQSTLTVASLEALTSPAPYGNTTRSYITLNVPSGPTWVRPTLTSTVWIGGSNTSIPVFTGGAPAQQLGSASTLLIAGFASSLLVILAALI